jgi:DNA polymerase III delta prime subunit
MYRAPLLFLRKRTFGFTSALENIILDLQQDGEIAQSLQNIAGFGSLAPLDDVLEGEAGGAQSYEGPEDVLFTMEANEEQFRIAQTLARHNCVLCQGPPGTGKTHTIANITGHLLAQGKSILITSSTTKALRVLREKIVTDLQPLCVSVLESDAQSNDLLKSSVDAIVERIGQSTESVLAKSAQFYDEEHISALRDMREARQAFLNARHRDSQPILIAGDSYTPIRAAKLVVEGQGTDAWIPGPVVPAAALTLTMEELRTLYRTNATVSRPVEKELAQRLPDPAQLPSPHDFTVLVDEIAALGRGQSHSEYWRDLVTDDASVEGLIDELPEVLSVWLDADEWLYAVGTDGFRAKGHADVWHSLFEEVHALEALAESTRELILRVGPSLAPDMDLAEQKRHTTEIVTHLDGGGNLEWFTLLLRGKWKELVAKSSVDGRPPKSAEEYRALQALASLEIARSNLRTRWARQVESIGGPPLPLSQPEDSAGAVARALVAALQWYTERFRPYNDALVRAGFVWAEVMRSVPTGWPATTILAG